MAVVAAAEAAGAFREEEEAAGEGAVDLGSLHWPLPLPPSLVASYKITSRTQETMQLWAGGMLHVLQVGDPKSLVALPLGVGCILLSAVFSA